MIKRVYKFTNGRYAKRLRNGQFRIISNLEAQPYVRKKLIVIYKKLDKSYGGGCKRHNCKNKNIPNCAAEELWKNYDTVCPAPHHKNVNLSWEHSGCKNETVRKKLKKKADQYTRCANNREKFGKACFPKKNKSKCTLKHKGAISKMRKFSQECIDRMI